MNLQPLLTIALVLLLAGCAALTKSEYERPPLPLPADWQQCDTGAAFLTRTPHWWDNFGDPQLSDAISQMLETNNDLAAAGIQLRLARAAAGLVNTSLTPDVSVSASASNSKNLNSGSGPVESYGASLVLGYELDLWGKLAREREQAAWQVQASEYDRQATALSLIGTTAQFYWQIASLNQQIDNQQRSLEMARQTQALVQSRYEAGSVSQVDLLQAEQSVISRANQLRDLRQQREEARNGMAILFNRPPAWRQRELNALDVRQQIPVASRVPLEVINHRPDVQSAEANLRAALAGFDASRLSFYPGLSLSAGLSAGSAAFAQWFSDPVRTLGASATLPFIQWNTVQLTIEKSDLSVQQAAIAFRTAAWRALSDVDNAMAQRITAQSKKESLLRDLSLSQRRLALVSSQYRAGAVSFQALLDAQDALLSSENALQSLQYSYLYATMKLWLALGGGAEDPQDHGGIYHE